MKRLTISLIVLFCLYLTGAMANKTSVEIKAPAEVKAGTEITVTISVIHKGNSKSHHTDWVVLKINGQEIKKWNFTREELPADGNFTLEYKYVANGQLNIEAEGHCNIHGTAGMETTVVKTN